MAQIRHLRYVASPNIGDDKYKILALPNKHIATYDYGEAAVSAAAIEVLRKKNRPPKRFEPPAYIQPWAYKGRVPN